MRILNRLRKSWIYYGGMSRKPIHLGIICTIGIFSIAVAWIIFRLDFFAGLELKIEDINQYANSTRKNNPAVTVLAIDEPTLATFSWPVSRDNYVALQEILNEYGAKAIVYDIAFIDKSARHVELDTFLAQAADNPSYTARIVHSFYFADIVNASSAREHDIPVPDSLSLPLDNNDMRWTKAATASLPYPLLLEHTRYLGHFHLIPDRDGMFRKVPFFINYNNRLYPALPLVAVNAALHCGQMELSSRRVTLSTPQQSIAVPIDRNGNMQINYSGTGEHFETMSMLSAFSLYKEAQKTGVSSAELERCVRDKIIIIGNTAPALGDFAAITMNNNIPKVYIHASAMATILGRAFFHPVSAWIHAFLIVFFLLLITASCVYLRTLHSAPLTGFLIAAYYGLAMLLCAKQIVLSTGMPILSFVLCYTGATIYVHFFKEQKIRVLESALEKYVSPYILDRIREGEKAIFQELQEREFTILFSDIKGFSILCNTMDHTLLFNQITEYLNAMSEIILDNNGIIDKFMGDGIMAYFDSRKTTNHASLAVFAALAMQQKMHQLNAQWQVEIPQKAVILIRIGINTGTVVIGNMGTQRFSDYTLFGNEVNLAQRLESHAQPGSVLISKTTREKTAREFDCRHIGKISPKGIAYPVEAFQVIGKKKLFAGLNSRHTLN